MKPRHLFLAIGLALPLNAFAQIPQTDWAGLAQAILSNYQKIAAAAEKIAAMGSGVDNEAAMAEQKVDAWNNAAANAISRMNQQRADVHNMEVAQDARPLMDACSAYSSSFSIEDAVCDYLDSMNRQAQAVDKASLASSPNLAATLTGKDPVTPAGASSAGTAPVPRTTHGLTPDKISPLVGIPVSVSGADAEDLQRMLDITFPAYEGDPHKRYTNDPEGLLEARTALRTNLARKMAGAIAARRQAESGDASEAGMVMAFGEQWYSPDRMETLTTGKTMTEETLWRDRAVSQAFKVWRSVNDYELALEREVILATQLLESLEKR